MTRVRSCLAAMSVVGLVILATVGTIGPAGATGNHGASTAGCIAHRFQYVENVVEPSYTPGCSGHDEPELDPLSSAPGSARDLTWTFVLPADGASPVVATGPAFWFGGTVLDKDSLFNQAFLEVQFYPDAIVKKCASNGGFSLAPAPNTYSVCAPVWQIHNNTENAAFNGMLTDGSGSAPLIMKAGDTVTIHFYVTSAKDGFHVTVTDLKTGHTGTIIINSPKHGPLMPFYSTQTLGNSLKWGYMYDAPMSFVWEIGHTSPFTKPGDVFCLPGQVGCESYNAPAWAHTTPIDIKGVTFGDGSSASSWAVGSDYGGTAEVIQYCFTYNTPYCMYPWFSATADGSLHFGVHYADTTNDFGKGFQYATYFQCGGPYGTNSTYCMTVLK